MTIFRRISQTRLFQPSNKTHARCCRREKRHLCRWASLRPSVITRRDHSSCYATLQQLPLEKIDPATGFDAFPEEQAVYAMYDANDALQFVGITRKLRMSVMNHCRDLPDLACAVKYEPKPGATKDELTEAWKDMLQEHVSETGEIPPGNRSDDKTWKAQRVQRAKPEIRLTPGKGVEDLTVSIEELIDQVVNSCRVVAFIKGTRTEPQCGFSYQMLTILNQNRVDYDVVNVLDEVHNPELREKIKVYSQWPTIPQLFVNGEFVGGADIVMEMQETGELQGILQQRKQ